MGIIIPGPGGDGGGRRKVPGPMPPSAPPGLLVGPDGHTPLAGQTVKVDVVRTAQGIAQSFCTLPFQFGDGLVGLRKGFDEQRVAGKPISRIQKLNYELVEIMAAFQAKLNGWADRAGVEIARRTLERGAGREEGAADGVGGKAGGESVREPEPWSEGGDVQGPPDPSGVPGDSDGGDDSPG